MKTQKQFILDTLLPYKNNSLLCGSEDDVCCYLTYDGRKCALGQHLKTGEWQNSRLGARCLFKNFGMEEVLTKEAYEQKFNVFQWMKIQAYHDHLSAGQCVDAVVRQLEVDTGLDLDELRF